MSRDALEIAVVGATGAAGEQLLAALGASDLPVGNVTPYGSNRRAPSVDFVEFRGASIGVSPLSRLANSKPDVAVLCVPPRIAADIAPKLVARGVFVVDAGNATAGVLTAPLAIPGVHADLPAGVAEAGAVRCPSPVGWLIAHLTAPLRRHGMGRGGTGEHALTAVSGAVALSASARGRAAIEELGQQVVATLTSQDPQRVIFPDGLAFDTLPEDVPPDEWSAAERLAAEEAGLASGLDASAISVTCITQPLFSGISASLHLRGVSADDAEAAWQEAADLHAVVRAGKLRPRAVLGKAGVWWGRLRADAGGDGVHVYAVADNLYGAGGDAPVRTLRWLHAAGLLGEV